MNNESDYITITASESELVDFEISQWFQDWF